MPNCKREPLPKFALDAVFEELENTLSFNARDWSQDPVDAKLWAILNGWDRASYAELQERFGWSEQLIQKFRALHLALVKVERQWNSLAKKSPKSPVS